MSNRISQWMVALTILILIGAVGGCAAQPKKKEPVVDVRVSNKVRVTVTEEDVEVHAPNTHVHVETDD